MDAQKYSLTVVIPTYNRSDALARCLAQLEIQTYKDFEVIVIDDGSTDDTQLLLTDYAKSSKLSFRHTRQRNSGPARARNFGVSLAASPICLLIGDDIFASPVLVEEHIKIHTAHPAVHVACLGLTEWCQEGQTITPFMRWLDAAGMQFNYTPLLNGQVPDWRFFYSSNLSLKSERLRNTPFNESFRAAAMEDMELACRLEKQGGLEIIFEPSALAYHFHPTTFRNACRRMETVGEASARFDALWPGRRSQQYSGRIIQYLKAFLRRNAWAIPLFVGLGEWSLSIACPNLLARYVLACHSAVGYGRVPLRKQDS